MRAVFLDVASLAEQDLDLSAFASLVDDWRSYPATAPDQRSEHIGDAEIVITNKVVLDDAVIRAAQNLRLVCVTATGYNNIALDTARERGIAVSNVVAYATDSVAQHVFALILAHHTRLFDYTTAVKRGDWTRSPQFCLLDYPVRELRGMTMGVVGYGELGKGVAHLAEAFGMRVIVSQRPGGEPAPGRVAFDEVLRTSDVISLHLPLLDSTHHLFDADALAQMKPEALLINTARGAIVDNRALADALRNGVIGGAGIDVLDIEPPPLDHPLLADDIPNLIVTPHSAWAGRQARQNVVDETVANIRAFLDGERRNRIV
ncbi:MAG: D-2-hydroxyacid dehydrogenase [Gammaproteobacteria bacterium]|nr:D-2-hydroxyacid dehydrogenase [Gammaproteobacteria bacterium]